MEETEFHRLADNWLIMAENALEGADAGGALEMENQNGALTLSLPSGKILLISKHAPTRQLWFSSPISGGLHFSYDRGKWVIPDGRNLEDIVSQELQSLANVKVSF